MSGSIGNLLGLLDQQNQTQNQVQQPPVQGLLGNATQLLPTDPFAAQRAATAAAQGQPPPGQQAPAISPMWGNWGGFGGVPGQPGNPAAGAVPADPNPGHMTFAQAQSQAAMPGQNPFPGIDPSHPLWQLMFNQYTNQAQTDPRLLFQQGQRGGSGGGDGGGTSGGGSGGQGQDASGQW